MNKNTNITDTDCCFCGSSKADTLFSGSDNRFRVDDLVYDIVRCQHCGLVRTNPRPTDSALGRYYPAKFYNPRFISNTGAFRQKIRQRRLDAIVEEKLSIINRFAASPGLLLDIGCAAGEFLLAARSKGWDVCGIEFDKDTAERVNKEFDLDIRTGSILDVELPDNVSVCTFWASLEHMTNPLEAFEKAKSTLVAGGYVIILVPNFASWESKLSGEKWPHLDIPRHLYHFEPESLSKMAKKAGFETLEILTPHTRLATSHWPTVLCNGWQPKNRYAKRILDLGFRPITSLLDRIATCTKSNHTLIGVFSS